MEEINNIKNKPTIPTTESNITSPVIETPPKQNNIFKFLFIISILVIIGLTVIIFLLLKNPKQLTITGNTNRTTETTIISTQSADTVATSTEEVNKVNNILKISNIQMEFPEGWIVSSVTKNEAKILTDYPNYQVYLTLRLNVNDSTADSSYKSAGTKINTNYGEIFNVQGGGPKGWTGALINGNKYSFVWNIESNQPVPENLDGIWVPDSNVTSEVLLDITKTVKPIVD